MEQDSTVGEVRRMVGNNWQKHKKIRLRISSFKCLLQEAHQDWYLLWSGSFKPSRSFNKHLLDEKVAA